ncbi:uncharacterized protein LOC122005624 [Zingiber officinale]|uniref:uncharacterized protein LOC122005624 n=1 Tax=Zingiber officinale TaxID=94328 RepID=UPI001C4AE1C7|nr:uncharacterized protein LOC122005624 [Zingiber officinale]
MSRVPFCRAKRPLLPQALAEAPLSSSLLGWCHSWISIIKWEKHMWFLLDGIPVFMIVGKKLILKLSNIAVHCIDHISVKRKHLELLIHTRRNNMVSLPLLSKNVQAQLWVQLQLHPQVLVKK